MNGRVEVIPATAMEFITVSYVGASTYQFMFDNFDEEDEQSRKHNLEALNCFIDKYAPATLSTVTDYFSSKEIQNLIKKHTGSEIDLSELNEMLTDMNYQYVLQDGEFEWMVERIDA